MEECRIPKTATRRGAISYAKLLTRVDRLAQDGYGFHGKLLRPGQLISESELGVHYSKPFIVLECTDIEGVHEQGSRHYRNRRKWDKLYILWRFDWEYHTWVEIVRTHQHEWVEVLREPARMALGRASWEIVPTVAEKITRIRAFLDQELQDLEDDQARLVLGELHDQFASRMVKVGAA